MMMKLPPDRPKRPEWPTWMHDSWQIFVGVVIIGLIGAGLALFGVVLRAFINGR